MHPTKENVHLEWAVAYGNLKIKNIAEMKNISSKQKLAWFLYYTNICFLSW